MSGPTDHGLRLAALRQALDFHSNELPAPDADALLKTAEKFYAFLTGEKGPEPEYRYFQFDGIKYQPYYRFRVGAPRDDAGAVERIEYPDSESGWVPVGFTSGNPRTLAQLERHPAYREVPACTVPLEIRQRL